MATTHPHSDSHAGLVHAGLAHGAVALCARSDVMLEAIVIGCLIVLIVTAS